MLKKRCCLYRIFGVIQMLILFLSILSGCSSEKKASDDPVVYTSLINIPGITDEEINAVNALLKKYDYFIFGSLGSIEAFYDENGDIGGYSALFCEWLTELFGIKFVPTIYEWSDLFPTLKADFSGDLTATEERKETLRYLFTDAIAERSTKFFRILGSQPRSEIIKIRPLKLAFLEGSTTSRAAITKLEETSVPYEAVYINDYETAYSMMKSGEVDAFIHEMVVEAAFDGMGDVIVEDFLPLIYEPVSLATQNPELKPIIDIVQKVLKNGGIGHFTDLYERGIKEYMRHKLFMRFDERELAYLRTNTKVAFLAEFDNYPLSFYNTNENQWQGIAFDILNEVTELTGLTFEPINAVNTSLTDLVKMLENNEGAMISELAQTTTRDEQFLWPTNESMKDNYAAISLDEMPNISVYRIMQMKVGVQKDTVYSDLFKKWFPNHPNVIEYEDVNAAFEGLEKGDADILMYSIRNLLTATNYHEMTGFKANIVFDYTFGSLFGFNINEEVLCSIVDKAMGLIETETISTQWMRKTFDYRSKILQSQQPYLIGAIVLFLMVIVLTFILYLRNRNIGRRLDKLVKQRTIELDSSRQDLSAALQAAKMANRAKSDFLAMMSHEIRTPLNAILGITQIQLQKNNLTIEYATSLEKIYVSGNNLLGIINDLLDMSKIETGKLKLNPAEYDMPSLINDAVQLNIVRIGSKPINFILNVDETLPTTIYGDELRLKQILNNLLSNAIKYTDKGHVELSVSHRIKDNEVILRFSIEDTGQGIRHENLKKLFSEYTRFNESVNRTTEGTGLGLSITKRLVEMMDGTIDVYSEYGVGSVFTVEVKQKKILCQPIGAELAKNLCSFTFAKERQSLNMQVSYIPMPYGKILVVDDVEVNLYVAEGLLSPYRLKIETAVSGFAAIEKVESGKVYDIIFMDHMMPQMDGIETTHKLRMAGYTGVIVALTANALAGNDKLFAEKGFDGFISKPMDIRKLNEVLNKFVRDRHLEEAKLYPAEAVTEAMTKGTAPIISATDQKLIKLFCRDAWKAIYVLRETLANKDLKLFATTAHGIKPVLANIGEREASDAVGMLEKAGRNGDLVFIAENIESFIKTLEELIQKHTLIEIETESENIEEDITYLTKHLQAVINACEDYDDTAAYASLDKLKEKQWRSETAAMLEEIHDILFLHSDFEGAVKRVEAFLVNYSGLP